MATRNPFQINVDKSRQVLALDIPTESDSHGGKADLLARPPLLARRMMPARLVTQAYLTMG